MLKSYEEMRKVDVKPYLEKRDGMDYLNWAMCIDLLHKMGLKMFILLRFQTQKQEVA